MGKTGKVRAIERELAEHFASLCLDHRPERIRLARWIARREQTLALAEPGAPAAAQPAAEALPTPPDARLHRIPVYDVRLVQSRSPLMLASPVAADSETSARALHSLIGLTDREHFVALFVNGGNHITGAHIAAIGGQHGIGCVDSRVILRTALAACASAIVLGHNHPSGDPSPSPEDITTTMHLMRAAQAVMGLFPAVLEEARGKGIDLSPKYIPAEVFDKRAVDKGQVVFHDVSFVEATPRYDKKHKRAVKIELTDFSVYYTQGAAEAVIAAMKEGKSEVMCEQGQLYKVSKSKDGIVKKEKLTKHWTDWVDYWAVDFDYMSRKEIIKVPVGSGLGGMASLPGFEPPQLELPAFEERWTGGYIFENEWQSFRTRQNRELELTTAQHTYDRPGRFTVAVKVIDIFGNDTMTLVPVNVG